MNTTILNVSIGDWVINLEGDYGLVKSIGTHGQLFEAGELDIWAYWASDDAEVQSEELGNITHVLRTKAEAKVVSDIIKGVIVI